MVEMECPNCGNVLLIEDKYRGRTGACKHCKTSIAVPGLEGEDETQVTSVGVLDREAKEEAAERREHRLDCVIYAVLAGFLCLGLGFVFGITVAPKPPASAEKARAPMPEFLADATPEAVGDLAAYYLDKHVWPKIVWLFSHCGVDPNVRDSGGESVLGWAVRDRDLMPYVRYLMMLGADPLAEDETGRSAADLAETRANLEALEVFGIELEEELARNVRETEQEYEAIALERAQAGLIRAMSFGRDADGSVGGHGVFEGLEAYPRVGSDDYHLVGDFAHYDWVCREFGSPGVLRAVIPARDWDGERVGEQTCYQWPGWRDFSVIECWFIDGLLDYKTQVGVRTFDE